MQPSLTKVLRKQKSETILNIKPDCESKHDAGEAIVVFTGLRNRAYS